MAEQAIFKSQAFGGFNKEEVLKYIDKMSAEHSEEQEKSNAEITEITAKLEEKNTELSETKENLEELQKKYDEIMSAYEELRQHYLLLKEHSDNIEAENEKLSARLEATEKELAIEKEMNSQLREKIELEERKAEEYAARGRKLSAAIGDAGDSTKLMLANAKAGAQSLIAEAQSSAEGINSEIDSFRSELEKTKNFMEDSLAVLLQRLEYIGKTAEAAKIPSEARSDKSAEIQKKFDELVTETDMRTSALKSRFFR